MILQLNPSIPVNTPKGPGEAILIIDYGKEDDLLFTVFLDETGQCWTFNNKEIRAIKNVSIGRTNVDDPENWPKCNGLGPKDIEKSFGTLTPEESKQHAETFESFFDLIEVIKRNQEAFGESNITVPVNESKEVHVGGVKILPGANLKNGEYYFLETGLVEPNPSDHNKIVKSIFKNSFWGY